jgi:hypothetical protein
VPIPHVTLVAASDQFCGTRNLERLEILIGQLRRICRKVRGSNLVLIETATADDCSIT